MPDIKTHYHTAQEFRDIGTHFSKLASRLLALADSMDAVGLDHVEVMADQLFNTYRKNVKKCVDTIYAKSDIQIADFREAEEERAEAVAASTPKPAKKTAKRTGPSGGP